MAHALEAIQLLLTYNEQQEEREKKVVEAMSRYQRTLQQRQATWLKQMSIDAFLG
jgi:hypothetical protein